VNDLANTLKLDAEQKETLGKIMEKSRDRYRALDQQIRRQYETARQQMRPQYNAIRNESREEIRQILREDQKARFEEFLKEMGRQRRERESKSPQ
jgi:F0F1-type ATP synthase membrane subunit b/b'